MSHQEVVASFPKNVALGLIVRRCVARFTATSPKR